MQKYNKFIVAIVGFAVSLASVYFGEAAWLPPVVSLLTALGVYATPNSQE